jgi:hypothetical protein
MFQKTMFHLRFLYFQENQHYDLLPHYHLPQQLQ